MFIWDFSGIITLSITLCLALVVGLWLFYTAKDAPAKISEEWQDLQQCPYCSYVFLDPLKKKGLFCPRCRSFMDDLKPKDLNNAQSSQP